MSHQTFLQMQEIELRRLLEKAKGDPILAPQLEERLKATQDELRQTSHVPNQLLPRQLEILPRAAVFVRGTSVNDSAGIRPSLAGELLIQYEKMFLEQAVHDEREAAREDGRRRRRRGAVTPGLWFSGTPRGSFGFEFTVQHVGDEPMHAIHAKSLQNVAKAVIRIADSEPDSLPEIIDAIPSRVLQPLKQFVATLAQHQAEIRLAFDNGPGKVLTANQIARAAVHLEREVRQDTVSISGVFRGVTLDTGNFDLRTQDNEVITGTVADDLSDDDLQRLNQLTNQPCTAELQKTTVDKVSGSSVTKYILVDAKGNAASSQAPPTAGS